MKKVLSLVLGLIMLCTCSVALAVNGNDCEGEYEYYETGSATFLLDNSGRIAGLLKPNENLGKLSFQRTNKCSPTKLEDGMAYRRRKLVQVELDNNNFVVRGGTRLDITVALTRLDLVQDVLGEDFTVKDIIDATIYTPCINPPCGRVYAGHQFLGAGSQRIKVGVVIFKNCKVLDLYVGYFDCDCILDLGFRAAPNKQQEETHDYCDEFYPCDPGCGLPCIEVTTEVTTETVVNTTTTTTTTVSTGDCGGCGGC
jgi:hypothetical protein